MSWKDTLAIGLSLWLSSCASLSNELRLMSMDVGTDDPVAAAMGLKLEKKHYLEALERWPWAEGTQLQRRALILAMRPDAATLARLDRSRSSDTEFRILASTQQIRIVSQP